VTEMILAGGWITVVILGISLVGFGFVIERFLVYSRARANMDQVLPETRRCVREGDLQGAMEVCNRYRGVVPEVYAMALSRQLSPEAEDSGEDFDDAVWVHVRTVAVPRLRKFLRAIALVARSAPMLGLLGTVWGMIELFSTISDGGTDPAKFTGGVGKALTTTAAGLLVAIPLIYCHGLLLSRPETIENDLDRHVPTMLGWLRWWRTSNVEEAA